MQCVSIAEKLISLSGFIDIHIWLASYSLPILLSLHQRRQKQHRTKPTLHCARKLQRKKAISLICAGKSINVKFNFHSNSFQRELIFFFLSTASSLVNWKTINCWKIQLIPLQNRNQQTISAFDGGAIFRAAHLRRIFINIKSKTKREA